MKPAIQYVQKNFDSLSILGALAHVTFANAGDPLSGIDHAVLAALRRANPVLQDASLDETRAWLQELDDEQIAGLVSNVKGILHEMEVVRIENEDGDAIHASWFEDTNHPGTDIIFVNEATGERWETQLKATDSSSYVNDWINDHPDGQIVVTDELAARMNLEGSGQSNGELTARVEDFIDHLLSLDDQSSLWHFVPALSLASSAMVVSGLWRRHRNGHINRPEFIRLAARTTGLKTAKVVTLCGLLTVPVIGQVTGAAMIASLLLAARGKRLMPDRDRLASIYRKLNGNTARNN